MFPYTLVVSQFSQPFAVALEPQPVRATACFLSLMKPSFCDPPGAACRPLNRDRDVLARKHRLPTFDFGHYDIVGGVDQFGHFAIVERACRSLCE